MTDLTVIDKGNHCEIHQGDAIAADYVASMRLANMFAAAPELLDALRMAADAIDFAQAQVDSENDRYTLCKRLVAVKRVIAKAEGITMEGTNGKERSLD